MKKYYIIGFIVMMWIVLVMLMDIPGWEKLDISRITDAEVSSVIKDMDGNEIMSLSGAVNRVYLKSDQIPDMVKNAFVAAEDVRFYLHRGIDVKRIMGALVSNIRSLGVKEGASTITQQLIKLTHLSGEKTIKRKTNEAYLALKLERKLDKDEILTCYINTVYFGEGAYGIESAARTYFSKSAGELDLSEAAMLAGILKAPSSYNPNVNYEKAVERRNYVLETMFKEGMITIDEKNDAKQKEISLNMKKEKEKYGWYRDYVISEAERILEIQADELMSGGYTIETCLDTERQKRAEALFEDDTLFPLDADDGTKVQAAFTCVDARTGGIQAIVGGRGYEVKRGLNRASDSRRQPGSVIKPISVYAAAVDALGLSPTYILDDSKRTFEGGYSPKNAGDKYNGLVTMREALSRSMNVASVSLLEFTGIKRTREYLNKFGIQISDDDIGLSLALGSITNGVTPLEIANAYASLANGGMKTEPHAINRILDRNGKVVYSYSAPAKRVISQESAYIMTDMLKTAAESGSARAFSKLNKPIAAKTGTVSINEDRNRDIWTAAYTDTVSACVWMGFDKTDERHSMSASASGSSFTAQFLTEFFEAETAKDFRKPEGIITVKIDSNALKTEYRAMLASEYAPEAMTITEVFRKGSEPTRFSPSFSAPDRPDAPTIIEKDGKVSVRITIENENWEYLILKEKDGIKEIAASVSGEKGERKETEIELSRLSEALVELCVKGLAKQVNGSWYIRV